MASGGKRLRANTSLADGLLSPSSFTPKSTKYIKSCVSRLTHFLLEPTHIMNRGHLTQEAHMLKILTSALILGGVFVSVMAPPNKTVPYTEMVTNNNIYRGMTGIKVSLPSDMKNFPVDLVPLP